MIEKRFRDKFMAKLIVEELMDKMLIETPTGIKILGDIRVTGFDQDIVMRDMTEKYGWLGGWMHLTDIISSVSSQPGRVFNQAYRKSSEWIGRIEPFNIKEVPSGHSMHEAYQKDLLNTGAMSSGLVQLMMRLAIMESITIDPKGMISISLPEYQERAVERISKEKDQMLKPPERQDSTQDMFFTVIRKHISPALSVENNQSLENTKDT